MSTSGQARDAPCARHYVLPMFGCHKKNTSMQLSPTVCTHCLYLACSTTAEKSLQKLPHTSLQLCREKESTGGFQNWNWMNKSEEEVPRLLYWRASASMSTIDMLPDSTLTMILMQLKCCQHFHWHSPKKCSSSRFEKRSILFLCFLQLLSMRCEFLKEHYRVNSHEISSFHEH